MSTTLYEYRLHGLDWKTTLPSPTVIRSRGPVLAGAVALVATAEESGNYVNVVDLDDGELRMRQSLGGMPCGLTWADGAAWLVIAADSKLRVVRAAEGVEQVAEVSIGDDQVSGCALSIGDGEVLVASTHPRVGTSIGTMDQLIVRIVDRGSGRLRSTHRSEAVARDVMAIADEDEVHHVVWRDWSSYHFNVWRFEDVEHPDEPRHLYTRYFYPRAHLALHRGRAQLVWRGSEDRDPAEGEVPLCHGANSPQAFRNTASPALGMTIVPR